MPELDFRDGKRNVPDHVAVLMGGLETYRLTYAEAVRAMNGGLLDRWIGPRGRKEHYLKKEEDR